MKLQDHNVVKGLIDALTGPRPDESGIEVSPELRDGMPVVSIDGIKCAVDVAGRVVQTGEGRDQRWFEVHVRDVTPKRFRTPEEQMKMEQEHEDWWYVSSSQRTVFVRNRSRSGAIEDFLRRFPGESASGLDMPEAELARGFEFIDDEGDRIRAEFVAKEVMETQPEPEPDPQYPVPGQNAGAGTGTGHCHPGQCSCGGCYPEPTDDDEQEPPPAECKPEDFYFGMGESPDGERYMVLVPKEFWDQNRHLDDRYHEVQALLPKYLEEPDMESTWILPDGKMPEDVAIDMVVAGFERSEELEKFLEAHGEL